MRRVFALLILMLGLLAGSGAAVASSTKSPTTTIVTLTGKISAGRDSVGLFGPWGSNLAGKAFTATYTLTTFASSSVSSGVDLVALSAAQPTTAMTFSLLINGHTFSGTAGTGSIETDDGLGGLSPGAFDRVQAAAVQTVVGTSVTKTFDMSASIQSALNNIVTDNKSLNAIPSLTYFTTAADQATGRFQYSQSPGTPSVLSYGTLSIDKVVIASSPEAMPVAAVPEPGEWAMMLAGLGVIAAASRRRRA